MTRLNAPTEKTKMCLACDRTYTADLLICPFDSTPLVPLPEEDELIGSTLDDRLLVNEKLWRDSHGHVFLATDTVENRQLNLKIWQADNAIESDDMFRSQAYAVS